MSTTRLAEVVSLYETNAADIPAMLRQAADNIETGEVQTKTMIAVAVSQDGDITLYGWGQTDSMNALAVLHLAAAQHAQAMIAGDE